MKIKDIKGREILDSRGNPTVEVDVILENGVKGSAIVASGASTGSREALELRDGEQRYNGLGVLKAVANINGIIKEKIIGMEVEEQQAIDKVLIKLDNTENKSKLGANAILGVSMACLKASAINSGQDLYAYVGEKRQLPYPMMNIINGGRHADNNLDFQEFMIIPQQQTIHERIRCGSEIFHALKNLLKEKGYSTGVGDEGGFAPNLKSNEEAVQLILEAISRTTYISGKDVLLGIDAAASEFFKNGKYIIENEELSLKELINFYEQLINKYPIVSIEDPVDENDWKGFQEITDRLGQRIQIVGDDLFVTNKKFLQKGIDLEAGNAILIKVNQIGTITETLETIKLARKAGYKIIISHRSGESEDTTIADLAVGLGIEQIKTGSLSRTDRVCKYNQLLRIEEKILDTTESL